ncbi:MAG: hypothetical protein ABL961_10675 [Vicinamibacterales bacterium]
MITQLLALSAAMAVSCFAPGFVVVRRFRWDPIETFTASVALSLVALYVLAFAAFSAGLAASANMAVAVLCAAACAVTFKDARRLLQSARLARCLAAFAVLALWTIGAQMLIRHYSGGEQCCDWVEHYERSTHFLHPKPDNYQYLGRYLLTARPPFMNVVCAQFMALVGDDFAIYQVIFSALNLFVFFPCVLIVRLIATRGLRSFGLLATVLAANPMFFENTTFAWTKALTAAYVVLGLWFYLAGLRRNDPRRLSAAFISLAAACLVHYSAVPYALFLGLHYLHGAWRHRRPLRAVCSAVVPSVLLLSTWFTWAINHYGAVATFASNSTVADTAGQGFGENLLKIAGNVWDTFRPHLFAGQPDNTAFRLLIDRAFMLYQVNLPLALGSVGCVVTVWLLSKGLGPLSRLRSAERRFWAVFIPFEVVVGIATHGERIHSGLAHIGLQPLVYMAVALVATQIPTLTARVRMALGIGMLVDFVAGVTFELYMEHSMAPWAWSPNWDWKANEGLVYLGDRALAFAGPVALTLAAIALLAGWRLVASLSPSPPRTAAPHRP